MKYSIEFLKRKMLIKYPFFGSVIANIDYKEDLNEEIASTDGKTIYYNPQYLNELTLEEQIFILAHEVCHIAFNHILRSEGKDPKLWNIATDAVTNQWLKKDGLKLVPGVVVIEEAINYDVETFYEKLLQEKQQSGQEQNNNQSYDNSQNKDKRTDSNKESQYKDVGHDSHRLWNKAVKDLKEEKQQSYFDDIQKTLEKLGEKESFEINSKEKKKQLEKLKQEIMDQAFQVGQLTNREVIKVENIGKFKPLIDWRYILKEAIKFEVDWSYKNANIEDGIITANLEEQPIPETEILLDTSGSININLLKNFLRECKNILSYSKIKVGCFDTEFYGFTEIRTEEDIDKLNFVGGGGTNFDVAISSFTRRVENKIIFTDGKASMPDVVIDAIWIIFGNEKINPKGGKVIYINDEQLNKLYLYENIGSKKIC